MKNILFLHSEDNILIQIPISVEDIKKFEIISSFIFLKIASVSQFLSWESGSDKFCLAFAICNLVA